MDSDWLSRSCPNCKSSSIFENPVVKSKRPAESMKFFDVREKFIGLREAQVFFTYFRCKHCGLLYAPRYFSADQLAQLYGDMPDNLMGEDKATISKTQSGYVKWLGRRLKAIDSFLEIGPDIGLVAAEMQKRYTLKNAVMIEPNRNVHHVLKENLSRTSIQILEHLSELEPGEKFDLIAGIHVYDHLLDPLTDLFKLREHANKDGLLLIVVHDEKSLLSTILQSKWPPYCLQHPQLYNAVTLEKLLNQAGWKLEYISKSTNWWHLDHFAIMGSKIAGIPSGFARFIPSLEVPMKLGNLIATFRKVPL